MKEICVSVAACMCVAFLLDQLISLSGVIKAEKGRWKLSFISKSFVKKKINIQNILWMELMFLTRTIIYLGNLMDLY